MNDRFGIRWKTTLRTSGESRLFSSLSLAHTIGFLFAAICISLFVQNVALAEAADKPDDVPWYLNNVMSTSLDTPAAAVQIPLSETVSVRGRVLAADGTPAKAAVVWAASVFHYPPIRERTLTDENGFFELNLKPLLGKSDRWSISAYQSNASVVFNGGQEWIDRPNPSQPKLLVGRLVPRNNTVCRILAEETGEPIGNARVFVGDGRVLVSDDNGEVVVSALKRGSHPVVVFAQGRVRRRVIFDNSRGGDGLVEVFLERAGKVQGRVIDESGKPIPYAWIKSAGSGRAMTLDGNTAIADSDGHFVWDGLRYNTPLWALRVGAEGFEVDSIKHLTATSSEMPNVEVRLQRDQTVNGKATNTARSPGSNNSSFNVAALGTRNLNGVVLDPDRGPIANVLVRWGATAYEEVDREVCTDAKGNFQLNSVPDRVGYVTVIADGYAPTFEKVEKGQTEMDISVYPGESLGGIVMDNRGNPISNVLVAPLIQSPDPALCNPLWINQRSVRSDRDGRFVLESLPSVPIFVDFLHDEFTESRSVSLEKGRMDHRVRLSSRGGFRGRVMDSEGNPIRNFRVTLDFPWKRNLGERLDGFSVVYRSIGVSYTNDEGQFFFGSEVSPGAPYRVTAHAPGFHSASIDRVVPTTLERLRESREYEFRLSPPKQFRLKIIDAYTKQPIEGARVSVISAREEKDTALFRLGTDDAGKRFEVSDVDGMACHTNLQVDQALVFVSAACYAHQRFGWRNAEKGFVVELVPEGTIQGRVSTEDGVPLARLSLSIIDETQITQSTTLRPGAKGMFKFAGLSSGKQTLTIYDEMKQIYKNDIRIRSGEHLQLDLIVDSHRRDVVRVKKKRLAKALTEEIPAKVTANDSLQQCQ